MQFYVFPGWDRNMGQSEPGNDMQWRDTTHSQELESRSVTIKCSL